MGYRKTPPWKETEKEIKTWDESRLRFVKIDPYKWSVLEEIVLSYWRERKPCVWHALVREDPKKYRATVWLREEGFVIREGYRYYPSKWAYMLYTMKRKIAIPSTLSLDQYFMVKPTEKKALTKQPLP